MGLTLSTKDTSLKKRCPLPFAFLMSTLRCIDRPCPAGLTCAKHVQDLCPFTHGPTPALPLTLPPLVLPAPAHVAIFGDLSNATHFPVPESTALEFKGSFGACAPEKTIQTVCAILNAGGGTLVVGVHDGDLEIVGVQINTKSYDAYLLTLDTILNPHSRAIRLCDDPWRALSAATVTTSFVTCANDKKLLFVHIRDVAGVAGRYMTQGGEVWTRLNASIRLENRVDRTVFSQQDIDSARQSERDRVTLEFEAQLAQLRARIRNLEVERALMEQAIPVCNVCFTPLEPPPVKSKSSWWRGCFEVVGADPPVAS